MPWFEDRGDHLVLNVRVVPRASRDEIAGRMGDALKVRIQAPPVDGKANAYLIKFLSKHWKIPKNSIEILSGETGRNKRLRLSNPTEKIRKELLSFGDE
ncbi:YggU family protein [Verrucomicrobia bacterium S94]|nr:YggU family protein [Verrucomicrobia bacterium S94]